MVVCFTLGVVMIWCFDFYCFPFICVICCYGLLDTDVVLTLDLMFLIVMLNG